LASHPRRADVRALLVELDPRNAALASSAARAAGLDGVEVLIEDAARTAVYAPVVPVDLALVCGVFGNIPEEHIHRTIGQLPRLLRPGGHVIWTRHRREPDLTPQVRAWFADAGFAEIGFDTEPGFAYGVGTHVLTGPKLPYEPNTTLFTFEGAGA
jgi:predicted O-methyltransferase YrrM